MSASNVVGDLLSTSSLLFDCSDNLCEETRRLVRGVGARRAAGDSIELRRLIGEGIDGGSLIAATLKSTQNGGNGGEQLVRIVADTRTAAAGLASMQMDRDLVVAARREAIGQREDAMKEGRNALAKELQASTALVNKEYLEKLRELAANNSGGQKS
jgi:hypothetical protein